MNSARGDHDFTVQCWGHAIHVQDVIDDGAKLFVFGISRSVKDGDHVLILDAGDPPSRLRYQITDLSWWSNPKDAWQATLVHAPHENPNRPDTSAQGEKK